MTNPERPAKVDPATATEEEIKVALENAQHGLQQHRVKDKYMHLPLRLEPLAEKLQDASDAGLEDDEPVSGALAAQRSIINSELFWHGRFLDYYD